MSVLFILIGFSLILAIIFLVAFIFSVKKGQFDDTFSPAHRILFDDSKRKKTEESFIPNDPNFKP
jgi:cbb3-type cytochrome oxidase maturation protein